MKWIFFLLLAASITLAALTGFTPERKAPPVQQPPGAEKIKIVQELPPLPAAKAVTFCYEWGPFSPQEMDAAAEKLAALKLEEKLKKTTATEASGFWTYIAPAKTKADAENKVRELNNLGIRDHFLIQEGKWRYAISLGMFKTLDAAKRQASVLQSRGAKSATAGARDETVKSATFAIHDVDEALSQQIDKLAADYPKIALKKSACN